MISSKSIAVLYLLIVSSLAATEEKSCPIGQECHYDRSCIVTALGIGATAAYFAPTVIGWGLGLMGFGPLGPILGSAASAWQAKIGLVAIGSVFAALQSAGMAGLSQTTLLGFGSAISSAVFATCPCKCSYGN